MWPLLRSSPRTSPEGMKRPLCGIRSKTPFKKERLGRTPASLSPILRSNLPLAARADAKGCHLATGARGRHPPGSPSDPFRRAHPKEVGRARAVGGGGDLNAHPRSLLSVVGARSPYRPRKRHVLPSHLQPHRDIHAGTRAAVGADLTHGALNLSVLFEAIDSPTCHAL